MQCMKTQSDVIHCAHIKCVLIKISAPKDRLERSGFYFCTRAMVTTVEKYKKNMTIFIFKKNSIHKKD